MTFQPSEHIQTILKNLPMKPGVYLMKDDHDKIIYVGKAKSLRNRVRSYFNSSAENNLKTMRLRENIRDIDFIVEENEIKALILEETLIKRYRPHYNISLKDDKKYPYIRVSWQDDCIRKSRRRAALPTMARATLGRMSPCGRCRTRCKHCAKPSRT